MELHEVRRWLAVNINRLIFNHLTESPAWNMAKLLVSSGGDVVWLRPVFPITRIRCRRSEFRLTGAAPINFWDQFCLFSLRWISLEEWSPRNQKRPSIAKVSIFSSNSHLMYTASCLRKCLSRRRWTCDLKHKGNLCPLFPAPFRLSERQCDPRDLKFLSGLAEGSLCCPFLLWTVLCFSRALFGEAVLSDIPVVKPCWGVIWPVSKKNDEQTIEALIACSPSSAAGVGGVNFCCVLSSSPRSPKASVTAGFVQSVSVCLCKIRQSYQGAGVLCSCSLCWACRVKPPWLANSAEPAQLEPPSCQPTRRFLGSRTHLFAIWHQRVISHVEHFPKISNGHPKPCTIFWKYKNKWHQSNTQPMFFSHRNILHEILPEIFANLYNKVWKSFSKTLNLLPL